MTTTDILRKQLKEQIDAADERALRIVQALLEVESEQDGWDDLSDDAKASIEQGLEDARLGRLTPHQEVMNSYKAWL